MRKPVFVASLLLFLFLLPAVPAQEMGKCEWKCQASATLPYNIVVAAIDEKGFPIDFKDLTEYRCERVSYCSEHCKDPDSLCKNVLDKKSQFTKTETISADGYWHIFTVTATTTFKCDDGSSYSYPHPSPYTFKVKDCSSLKKAWQTADAEAARLCGEVGRGQTETGGAAGEICIPEKQAMDDAKAELSTEESKQPPLEAERLRLKGELDAKEAQLEGLKEERAGLEATMNEKKAIYDNLQATINDARWAQTQYLSELGISSLGPFGHIFDVGVTILTLDPKHLIGLIPGVGPLAVYIPKIREAAKRQAEAEKALPKAWERYQEALNDLKRFDRSSKPFMDKLESQIIPQLQSQVKSIEKKINDLVFKIIELTKKYNAAEVVYNTCLAEHKAEAEQAVREAEQKAREAEQEAKEACDAARQRELKAYAAYKECLDSKAPG